MSQRRRLADWTFFALLHFIANASVVHLISLPLTLMAKGKKSLKALKAEGQRNASNKPRINLCDPTAIKHALDEAAVNVITTGGGYRENHYVSDRKIALGLLTCTFALVAQFYPKKFPDNWWILLVCVVLYSASTTAMNLFVSKVEGDSFLLTYPKGGVALRVRSQMPRYSYSYTLALADAAGAAAEPVEETCEVTVFFHSDGVLAEGPFSMHVLQLLREFESRLKKSK